MQEGHKSVLYDFQLRSFGLTLIRREAANQTQWFEGIIRTVYSLDEGI
jgi:hypothetical protein